MPENFVRKPPFLHHDVPLTNSTWLTSQPNRHPHGHLHPAAHHRCPHPPQLPISIAQGSRNHTAEETPKPQLVAGSIGHPFAAQRNGWRPNGGGGWFVFTKMFGPYKIIFEKKHLWNYHLYSVDPILSLKNGFSRSFEQEKLAEGKSLEDAEPWGCREGIVPMGLHLGDGSWGQFVHRACICLCRVKLYTCGYVYIFIYTCQYSGFKLI